MILVYQDDNSRVLGFGSPAGDLTNHEIILSVYQFPMVLREGNWVYPTGSSPKLELVTTEVINNSRYIDPATLLLSDDNTKTPAFTFMTSRTVGDAISNAEELTKEQILALTRYSLDAVEIENFILANGYLTGTRL